MFSSYIGANSRTRITEEHYQNDGITVHLEWIHEDGMIPIVAIMPEAPLVSMGSASVQMLLHYNTLYNMSITIVDTICGQNHTSITELHYGMSAKSMHA